MRRDLLIHTRLRKRRLVAFIVAPAPIADKVNQEVLAKAFAIGERHARHRQTRRRIVRVHMDNGNLEPLRKIAGIKSGAGIAWIGGKTDLIVDDDMDGSTDAITLQLREVEGFRDDTLPGKSGIPMNEH